MEKKLPLSNTTFRDGEPPKVPEDLSHLEVRMMASQHFQETYGIQREELYPWLQTDVAKRLAMNYMQKFPQLFNIKGLRKMKARGMWEAMSQGMHKRGNHTIDYRAHTFTFYYRDTVIYKWDAIEDEETEVHAGDYEGTVSTFNQRKQITSAIQNFKESLNTL